MQKNSLSKSIQKNIKILKTIFFICGLFFCGNFVSAAALNLPKDSEGWTIFTPSSDSRIMYVSETGDDLTGAVYTSTNHPTWSAPQEPTGDINAFATIAAAWENVRDGYPDWVLIKRGDTLYETLPRISKDGRSSSEPLLVGAYGSSGLSPLLKVGSGRGIYVAESAPFGYLAVQGIRFYAHTRNPDDPEYNSTDNGNSGVEINGRYLNNILIEGCAFMYPRGSRVNGDAGYSRARDVDLRRNRFLHSYQILESHVQGFGSSYTENLFLEENIFDHNGWLIQAIPSEERPMGWNDQTGGQATKFNHNTYLSGDKGSVFKGNVSIRPSSIHFKHAVGAGPIPVENLVHDNNLLIDGEVGVDASGNNLEFGVTINNYTFKNNILYKIGLSRPTDRGLSWGITLAGYGEAGGSVHNNIFLGNGLPSDIGVKGLCFGGPVQNMDVYSNIFYGGTGGAQVADISGEGVNVSIRDNVFKSFSSQGVITPRLLYATSPTTGYTFSGNAWYGNGNFNDNESFYSPEQWKAARESTAIIEEVVYPDDTRTVETYMASIGEIPTLDEFIELSRNQDRYNWDTRIMASEVNSYIRAGFGMEPMEISFRADVDGSSQITTTDALLTLRNSLGLSMNGTAWQTSSTTGDVNCDGVSNSTDALLILRYSLGLNMGETGWCE